MENIAGYYPIVTTIFSFLIAWEMAADYREERRTYLLCWAIGVSFFGLAALGASINLLAGWSPGNLKFWYIIGALVGGFPLAQGSLYFLANRKLVHGLTIFFSIVIVTAAIAVMLTPISLPPRFDHELTGKVFAWKWVRYFSPLINIYSFLVLLCGGVWSVYRYYSHRDRDELHLANANISAGALVPGCGGILMRMGYVNALFVTDFLALVLIYLGYRVLKNNY